MVKSLGTSEDWKPWPFGTGAGLLDAAAIQFEEYFSGRLLDFDLPLEFDGTAFQTTVWKALTKIPYGETRTYGDIAGRHRQARRSASGGQCEWAKQPARSSFPAIA